MLKTVTLQEANGLLPLIREHFLRIHVLLSQLQQARDLSAKKSKHYVLDKDSHFIKLIKKTQRRSNTSSRRALDLEKNIEQEVAELSKFGVAIKGLMPPHIDFLSHKNNEPIFLCWHGERHIEHWHYLDDGPPFRHVIKHHGRFGPTVEH